MAIIERKVLMTGTDSNGNTFYDFPITSANYIEGLHAVAKTGDYNKLTNIPSTNPLKVQSIELNKISGNSSLNFNRNSANNSTYNIHMEDTDTDTLLITSKNQKPKIIFRKSYSLGLEGKTPVNINVAEDNTMTLNGGVNINNAGDVIINKNIYKIRKDPATNQNVPDNYITQSALDDFKKEIRQYVDKGDLINIAPQIGYFQEDKLQVISNYYINNLYDPSDRIRRSPVITTDNIDRIVMYFIANDGGPNRRNVDTLRKAYKVNESSDWIWYNDAVIPYAFKNMNIRIVKIYGCDNDYLIVKTSDNKYYYINTNYSFDENDWKTVVDITSIVTNTGDSDRLLHVKYFKQYNTIVFINGISHYMKDQNWFRVRVYNFTTKKLLRTDDIIGPSYGCCKLADPYSFITTRNVKYFSELTTNERNSLGGNLNYGTISSGFQEDGYNCSVLLFEKQNTMVILRPEFVFNVVNFSNKQNVYVGISGTLPLVYTFPIQIAQGNTSTSYKITLNLNKDDIIMGGSSAYQQNISTTVGGIDSVLNVNNSSYDSMNSAAYRTYFSGGSFYFGYSNYKESNVIQSDKRYNGLKATPGIYNKTFYTPDAALWGKGFAQCVVLWDRIFINCFNKDGNHLLLIKNWRFLDNYANKLFIEPQPNKFIEIQRTDLTDIFYKDIPPSTESGYDDLNTFITGNTLAYNGTGKFEFGVGGFISVKNTNASVSYYKCQYLNGKIYRREYTYTETSNSFQVNYTDLPVITVSIPQSAFNTGNNPATIIYGGFAIYNPLANMCFVFGVLDTGTRSSNDNIARTHIVGIKINSNNTGTVVTYGEAKTPAHTFNNSFFTGILSSRNDNQYRTPPIPTGANIINKTTMQVFFRSFHNGGRLAMSAIYTFNSGLTDFTISNCIDIPGGLYWMTSGKLMTSLVDHIFYYSGPTLGFCGCGETRAEEGYSSGTGYADLYKIDIRTQNKLLGTNSNEKTFTDANCTTNYFTNVNTYTMYMQSSSGLVAYIPSTAIFLGGYYSVIENPIPVTLTPNLNSSRSGATNGYNDGNYIYLSRDSNDRDKLITQVLPQNIFPSGSKQFSKILIAKIETDSNKAIKTTYYTVNTGFNSYKFN